MSHHFSSKETDSQFTEKEIIGRILKYKA